MAELTPEEVRKILEEAAKKKIKPDKSGQVVSEKTRKENEKVKGEVWKKDKEEK